MNGVELHVTEAGDPEAPPVICAHGFPESSYSWRYTLPALADAGWHAIAPDLRGYGTSSRPPRVEDYSSEHVGGDLLGLLAETGHDQGVFVGHDWGALVTWDLARTSPERCRAVVGGSVPFIDWPAPPTELFAKVYGDRFFYILYFQPVGPAETELEADVRATLRRVLWSASAEGVDHNPAGLPAVGTGFLDSLAPAPEHLPAWLSESDIDAYTEAFAESGFFGPLSYYRNLDANHERVRRLDPGRLTMPIAFIAGARDPVIQRDPRRVETMRQLLPGFREATLVPDVGHWVQQEAPERFNAALIGFLARL